MRPVADFPISLRIALPLLAALVLVGGPRLGALDREMRAAQAAGQQAEPLAEARHLQTVVLWEPWREDLWLRIGTQALRGGDSNFAIQALTRTGQPARLPPEGALALGEAYWAQEKFSLAQAAWDPLIEAGNAPKSVFQRIIQWKRQSGALEEACHYAQAWKQTEPKNGLAAYTWDLLAAVTQSSVSQTDIMRAAELDPGLTARVKPLMDALGKTGSNSPVELRRLEAGRALGSLGEWDLALYAFQKAREANPEFAEAWAYSGMARQQLRQDGAGDVKKAVKLKPASAALQAMAGLLFRQAGDYESALRYYQKAAELEPKNVLWLMETGSLYADLHDTRAGLAQYQKAAAIEPGNWLVWQQFAEYSLANELEIRAVGLPAARQAVTLAPDSARALDTLGQIMAWLGDGDSAERFLQQALQKDPSDATAALHLGQMYLNWGRREQAEYFLAQAARTQGQSIEANVIAGRLLDRYFGRH